MKQTKANGTEIVVPQLAESLVSATISKWLKQPGDEVREYEAICELITDKVNAELPSPVEGTLKQILVTEGQTVEVGTAICIIEETGRERPEQEEPAESPVTRGTGVDGYDGSGAENRSHRYSPAVLKLAAEHGVDLKMLKGSGLGGRITRKDVLQYVQDGKPEGQQPDAVRNVSPASAAAVATEAVHVPVRSTGLHLTEHPPIPKIELEGEAEEGRGEYLIDVTPIRNTIASRTRQSVSEIPHAWTMIEVDVTNLVQLRNSLKDEFKRKEGINLTYLSFLLKAVVNAIKDYPIMNSVWAVDKIIVKRDINISLLVGTEDFVLTPVIKKADQKNIAGLAREIDELARKARAGKLSLSDTEGGTFTVNNTGSFGSILSYPIINYPQAAILTFESIVKRPVVIQDMIAVRSMVNLCLSLDHRILDGVICGRFLQRVKENLESYGPDTKLY